MSKTALQTILLGVSLFSGLFSGVITESIAFAPVHGQPGYARPVQASCRQSRQWQLQCGSSSILGLLPCSGLQQYSDWKSLWFHINDPFEWSFWICSSLSCEAILHPMGSRTDRAGCRGGRYTGMNANTGMALCCGFCHIMDITIY